MRPDDPSPTLHRRSPRAWRWMLLAIAVLVVLSLWVPTVPSEPPEARTPQPWITAELAILLVVGAGTAALALPASWPARLVLALVLVASTLAALALETPIRRALGAPWWP